MISVNDVTMNFGARMLFDAVTVTFNAGERYGLTGPNGSGKTSLLRILCGLAEPAEGEVRWAGSAIRRSHRLDGRELRRRAPLPA